ncbi:hypothetical protein BAUCODRAFT_71053 [Baudoinia panamericana UAMH 10762]|uniref:Zn(2)-C6 fungal-type domain-containing protein n=1 Tax=Baudoinia panamericana (strain UAMH 10762) TaxID=717646 RepID=M2N8Z6_BAUPA|nr:uncharacterized protein BAUCODRAFT_71053 [Baudoinia panamericana UAMH 10762]EMC95549.1 hypothetical protein BAUCODRAFT_71053 [Baudoinia panamericana UAMH 10762]
MSQYPPVPPPDQTHYNALYPATAGAQQLLDPSQQETLQYTSLNTPAFPKVETTNAEETSPSQIQHLAQDFRQHSALEDQQRQQIRQAAQQIHHQAAANLQSQANLATPQTPLELSAAEKSNRLRKACDSCSIRKVKCDEAGPPCRACAALDIPCTFNRPSRRRGPPNRHAEAIKRRRLEEAGNSPHLSSSPSSPTHAAQALAALSAQTSSHHLSAESICPLETLDLLIDDFFTYIHPLCPFPHEPSFREAWKRREDLNNKSFLALLAAMIGALVSSFPRKPRIHLKAHKRENMFPNHMSLVHRCQQVCAMARGPGYLESDNLSVYDAATSYFLALTGVYTFRWRLGRLYFGECLTIVRTLGLHKAKEQTYTQLGALPSALGFNGETHESTHEQPVDNITLEMGRRVFWTMFVTIKMIQQLGASFGELVISPPTSTEPYPPLPAEVDDFCIYPTHNEPQPHGLVPIIAGFNANVRVYCSYNSLATMEMAWGIDAVVDWERQKKVLHESLRRCKNSIAELPPELKVVPNAASLAHQNGVGPYPSFAQPNMQRDPAHSLMSPSQRLDIEQTPEQRRRMQYEIQKANIYASSLSTRSYIVEKFFNLCEAHDRSRGHSVPGSVPSSPGAGVTAAGLDGILPQAPTSQFDGIAQEMRMEREDIVKDLLVVLCSIDQVNMEPNADSFTMKIRSIASTLLDSPDHRKGQLALQAQEYLAAFLKILMKLERVSPANSDPDQPEDEEAELRQWADLRQYQMKFAQQGGLMGLS